VSDPGSWPPSGGRRVGGTTESGSYYYPPGAARPGPGPPPAPRRRSRRGWLWAAVAAALAVALLSSHRITEDEVILFCVIVPSIILHEVTHGWVALAFGDDTAKRAGRLTLNPLAHVDLIGTIIVPVLMIFGGFGWFGWAKPVPVNLSRLRSPRNQGVLVSLAGPATNALLAAFSAVVFHLAGGVAATDAAPGRLPLWVLILVYLGLVNVWLMVFNLLPIPPLDGSAVIERALPGSWWSRYLQLRRYAMPVLIVAVLLAATVHVGNSTLLGRFAYDTESWWLRVLGV
jgi:Zn-dependent protease